jgi:hypothetical protein
VLAPGQPDFPPSVAVAAIGPGGVVGPTRTPAPNLNLAAGAALVPVGTKLLFEAVLRIDFFARWIGL